MRYIVHVPHPPHGRIDRCLEVARLLERLAQIEGNATAAPPCDPPALALQRLGTRGRITFELGSPVRVVYLPSREGNVAVARAAPTTGWEERTHKHHLEAFRTTPGAIFRFPSEDGGDALEIFITDWSPCPAAGAVAVHRYHPFVRTAEKQRTAAFFTGKFVRHPLTGDLLPVWVADWVKPDFGTGAVLVNPAHDSVDLAFGRAVGLPIRFGLVPGSFDGRPETWPVPPIIKHGRTIKTGPFDGLSPEQAIQEYFEVLKRHQFAERHTDVQAGSYEIATLTEDVSGDTRWCDNCGTIVPADTDAPSCCEVCGHAAVTMRLGDTALLEAATSVGRAPSVELVCGSKEQGAGLLFLRLLCFDLYDRPVEPSRVHIVQPVQEAKDHAGQDASILTSLVAAPPRQVAVLRPQLVERVERFVDLHADLAQHGPSAAAPSSRSETLLKTARNAKHSLVNGNPVEAFSYVAALQKQLTALAPEQRVVDSALGAYFAVAYVLFGLHHAPSLDIRDAWTTL